MVFLSRSILETCQHFWRFVFFFLSRFTEDRQITNEKLQIHQIYQCDNTRFIALRPCYFIFRILIVLHAIFIFLSRGAFYGLNVSNITPHFVSVNKGIVFRLRLFFCITNNRCHDIISLFFFLCNCKWIECHWCYPEFYDFKLYVDQTLSFCAIGIQNGMSTQKQR